MTPDNTPATPEVEVEVEAKAPEVTSQEKQDINAILIAQEKFPPATNITRNNVTVPLVPKPYGRGNRKNYGCKYLGIPKEFFSEENLPKLYELIGAEKVLSLFESFLNQIGVASSENAIDEVGNFQLELVKKGFEEFSARGEPSSELRERYAEAQKEFQKFMAQPQYIKYMQVGADGKPVYPKEFKEFQRISEELTYTGSTLMDRQRPKKAAVKTDGAVVSA